MKDLILTLLHARDQLHIWHWQTESYSQHIALGEAYEAVEEFTDDLVETLGGQDRNLLKDFADTLQPFSNNVTPDKFLSALNEKLEGVINDTNYSDNIVNLRQDIVSKLERVIYKLTLT